MREIYATQLAIITGFLIVVVTLIFALIQSPEMLAGPERTSTPIPHPVEGYEPCDRCHGLKGVRPYPIKHLGWNEKSCIKCHMVNVLGSNNLSSPSTASATTGCVPVRSEKRAPQLRAGIWWPGLYGDHSVGPH